MSASCFMVLYTRSWSSESSMRDVEERLKDAKELFESGSSDAARVILLEILKQEPNNSTALLMLGGAYFYEQKFAEAEMVYERLVLAEPGSGLLSIALFNSLWNQGKHEDAAGEIRRFIAVADKVQERETLERYAEIIKSIAGDD